MFVQELEDGRRRLVTSASDLAAASACEFAFLRRVDARLNRRVEVPPDDDPMLARAARLGDAHEERTLARYRRELADGAAGGGGVVEIPRPESMSERDLLASEARTREALAGAAEVVFQATFFEPVQRAAGDHPFEVGFVGFADFLRRLPGGAYEVQDTKLARRARATALLQLAAYAEQLERLGVGVAPEAVLILGDETRSRHDLADIGPVLRARRAKLHEILLRRASAVGADGRTESAAPVAWGDPGVVACGRCEVCEPEVVRARDPLLIAGIRRAQRDRLVAAGLDTVDRVAEAPPGTRVEGVRPAALEGIVQQAEAQVRAERGEAAFRMLDPSALALVPQPDAGDLFFDFEGDPLYREAGADGTARWGIDYLFGMVDSDERFTPIWAHDLDGERAALERFVAFVVERRRRFPSMKIYHYAPYERTHLLAIAARHGVCEAEVDRLLREHVLVDLYPIVRRALRVGSRSYSIKQLEPLYMGERLRDEGGVTSGAQSVAEYAEASALLASDDAADRAAGEARMRAIADYNEYDCVSTLRLRDWLLGLAAEHGVRPYRPEPHDDDDEAGFEADPVAVALLGHAEAATQPADREAAALAACAIDYHRREQKSFWWAHYARLVDPVEEWADTRDVLVVDATSSRVEQPWHTPEGARSPRRRVRLRGELAPGSTPRAGGRVFLLYEHPAPFATPGAAPGARGAKQATVVEVHDDGLTVEELVGGGAGAGRSGVRGAAEEYGALPVAVAPGAPPPPGQQKHAIREWGSMLAYWLDRGHFAADPVVDLLRRSRPRLAGGRGLCDPASDEARAAGGSEEARTVGAVAQSLRALEHSALAVQGPPGTGKTYLAAQVVRRLVEHDGWRVGVVAQSHRVVENVLTGCVAAGIPGEQVGKVPQGGGVATDAPPPDYTVLPANGHRAFAEHHRRQGRGCVIGGTAWDFSNEARFPRKSLDLLVVDEAGQFSLAHTIAASVAAHRLLLLGDPQQLPQVSQGSHPEPVDASALGWLLGDAETMPADRGYFLAETRRMRPELADVVSELSYEGRLRAHPSAAEREVVGAGPPGLVWHPVEHEGNSTSSPEEAEVVVRIAAEAMRGGLSDDDLIVVAAYNAQVECLAAALSEAGLGGIRVGTVDRFQGQEAVVAIVSLAASSPEEAPRGLEFLLMRNRLNVAISRARWAAHLVSSPGLGDGLPTSAEGLAALGAYLRLTERARVEGG